MIYIRTTSPRVTSLPGLAWSTARSHGRLVISMLGALAVLGVAQAGVILLVRNFLEAFFQPSSAIAGPLPLVVALPATVLLAGLAKAWGTYLYTRLQQEFSLLAGAGLRDRLFPAILGKPWLELAKVSPGAWMSILVNDVAFVQSRLTEFMTSFLRGGMSVIASLATMLFIHWPSALVMMAIIPVIARYTGSTGKRIAGFSDAVQQAMRRMADLVLETRARFDFMRAQHGEATELGRFDTVNDSFFRTVIRSIMVRSSFAPVMEFMGFAIFAGFILAINHGLVSFGEGATPTGGSGGEVLLQFVVALGFMVKPLREIGEQLARYHETRGALQKCFDLLGDQPSIPDPPAFPITPVSIGGMSIDEVGFTWPDSRKRFHARNLNLSPGKCVAIVGPSGAGKSTFLKIMAGLLRPDVWASAEPWESVSARVSLVPQQPFLFSASVRDNVTYGAVTASDAKVWAALDAIDARAFVESLPGGLEAPVSSLVANLSGGQIQRLVIARALLRDKGCLLLDEATSALDVATEGAILRRLVSDAHAGGSVLIAVTHRMQSLALFDEIWFVEDGILSLRGSWTDMVSDPRFVAFCNEPGPVPS